MKIRSEIKIAALFIVALTAFIWGYNYLKGKDLFTKKLIVYAKYDEVGGLASANPVYVNGLKIGQVNQVYFEGGRSARIIVKMMLNRDLIIPKNSIARIFSADLMGSKAIDIVLGNSNLVVEMNDTLQSDIQASLQEEVNRQVQPIKMKAEELLSSIDTLVTAIQTIFNEEARINIAQSFESIKLTIHSIEHASFTIDTLIQTERRRLTVILENIEAISSNLRNNNTEIAGAIKNIKTISDSLAASNIRETFSHLEHTMTNLNQILGKIETGEGSLGLLINDKQLYESLESASKELSNLLEDMRLNPGRYIHFSAFGSRASRRPYTPKEK
ncbi:MAG: MlaD family protein [Bacteroidales bacterium]